MAKNEMVTLQDIARHLADAGPLSTGALITDFTAQEFAGVSREGIRDLLRQGVNHLGVLSEDIAKDPRQYECTEAGYQWLAGFKDLPVLGEPKVDDRNFALPASPTWPSKEHPLFGRLVALRDDPLFPKGEGSPYEGNPRILGTKIIPANPGILGTKIIPGWSLDHAELKLVEWTHIHEEAVKAAALESEKSVTIVDLPEQPEAVKVKPTSAPPQGSAQQDQRQVVAALDQRRLKLAQQSAKDADARALKLEQRAVKAERELQELKEKLSEEEATIAVLVDPLKKSASTEVPMLSAIKETIPDSHELDGSDSLASVSASQVSRGQEEGSEEIPTDRVSRLYGAESSEDWERHVQSVLGPSQGAERPSRRLVRGFAIAALVLTPLMCAGIWFANRDTGSSEQSGQQVQQDSGVSKRDAFRKRNQQSINNKKPSKG